MREATPSGLVDLRHRCATLELAGMGVASGLARRTRRFPLVGLTQPDPVATL